MHRARALPLAVRHDYLGWRHARPGPGHDHPARRLPLEEVKRLLGPGQPVLVTAPAGCRECPGGEQADDPVSIFGQLDRSRAPRWPRRHTPMRLACRDRLVPLRSRGGPAERLAGSAGRARTVCNVHDVRAVWRDRQFFRAPQLRRRSPGSRVRGRAPQHRRLHHRCCATGVRDRLRARLFVATSDPWARTVAGAAAGAVAGQPHRERSHVALLFGSATGVIDFVLGWLGRPEISSPVGDVRLALPTTIAVEVWRIAPFVTFLLLPGLASIPTERWEDATLNAHRGSARCWTWRCRRCGRSCLRSRCY